MPYKRKKTGTKQEKRTRVNQATGNIESYYVNVDVFENVYEPPSSSNDSGRYSPYDSGSYGSE